MVLSSSHSGTTVITLLPNRSASWAQTRLFLFLFCGTTLAIGLLWAFAGVWAILPFSGLEAGLLAYFMYRVCQSTYRKEVIKVDESKVCIEAGSNRKTRSWELQRHDTHLQVEKPSHYLDAISLQISDLKQTVELGSFLNKDDKELALSELRNAGVYVRNW